MKLYTIFLSVITILLFASCKTETTTHFNKDFSGSSVTSVNLEPFIDFAKIDANETDLEELETMLEVFDAKSRPDSIANAIDSINLKLKEFGLYNFNVDLIDSTTFGISVEFDDIDAISGKNGLDIFMQALDQGKESHLFDLGEVNSVMKNSARYERDGNSLIIDLAGMSYDEIIADLKKDYALNDPSLSEEEQQEILKEGEEYMLYSINVIGEFMKFKQTYTFDKKVKDVECNLPVNVSKHKIEINYTLNELIEQLKEDNEVMLQVKLK